MEGQIIIKGGKAAMEDARAQRTFNPESHEAVVSIEANCRFSGIADKARILSGILDAFSRDSLERMLIMLALVSLEKTHRACDDKDREQIIYPKDESSPDGFSDVGMLKSLFDKLSGVD